MGVLVASGSSNLDAAPGGQDPAPEPAKDTPAAEPAESGKDFVPFSRLDRERQPGSRREKAERQVAEAIEARVKPLEEKWTSDRDAYEKRIQTQQEELARMRGMVEALQRPAAPAPAPAAPRGPSSEEIIAQAEEALGRNDLRTYHMKLRELVAAESRTIAQGEATTVRKDLEARIPPAMPPEIQGLMAQHRNVAMAGQRGIEAVILKDRELGLYHNAPQGYQRMAKAFELADKQLADASKPTPRQSFSQDGAAALAAVPTGRPGGASTPAPASEPGYQPTDADRVVMRAMKWTPEEFVKWKHPERWMKR